MFKKYDQLRPPKWIGQKPIVENKIDLSVKADHFAFLINTFLKWAGIRTVTTEGLFPSVDLYDYYWNDIGSVEFQPNGRDGFVVIYDVESNTPERYYGNDGARELLQRLVAYYTEDKAKRLFPED